MSKKLPDEGTQSSEDSRRSLSSELIRWFVMLALLPMGLVAWLSYQQAHDSLTAAATSKLDQEARATVAFIRNWFDYRFMDLAGQSESQQNTALLMSLRKGLLMAGSTAEHYVRSAEWAGKVVDVSSDLKTLLRRYDYIHDIFLVDEDGNILFTIAQEDDLGGNLLSGRLSGTHFAAAVRGTLEHGESLFSELEHYSPSSNRLAGFLTAPLRNDEGVIIGVFAVQVDLERVFKRFTISSTKKTSQRHYLIGRDGLLRTPIRDKGEILSRTIDTEQLQHWHREHTPMQTTPVERCEEAHYYTGPDGKAVIGMHQELHLPGINWLLISEIDVEEALAPANWLARASLVVVALTALLTGLLAVFKARRITRPIITLADAAMAVAAGQTEQRVAVQTDNEIGQLAKAFNHMLSARQRHEQLLDQRALETQQALSDLEEQKFALDQHAIVAITDVKGTITYANDSFCDISGYSREELIGQNHRILNSGEKGGDYWRDMYRTLAAGEVWHDAIRNKAKNGELYWLDTTIVPFKGADGKPQSYISIRTDISDRIQADRIVEESRRQLELVIDSTAVGVWDWQVQTGTVIFNEHWAEIVGYTLDELQPIDINTWLNLTQPDDREMSSQLLDEHWRGKSSHYVCEARMLHKQGHWVWVLNTGKVVEWQADGQPKRMIGTQLDITERKNAEEKLRANEASFRFMLDNSPVAVRIAKNNGQSVAYANPTYQALINAQDRQVTGDSPVGYYADPNVYAGIIDQLSRGETINNRLVELLIPDKAPSGPWPPTCRSPTKKNRRYLAGSSI